jgi:myosin heavy subunit
MCHMTVLNEPEVLNNLIERYKKDLIFTYIGPTLIILNPYKYLPQLFDNNVMLKIRQKIF